MGQMENPSTSPQPEEETYQHRHCNSSDVFWQDGVAHCITCGQRYPPYESVEIYASQYFMVSTYLHLASGEQRVIALTTNDSEVPVEEAEALGRALQNVPRIKIPAND